MCLWVHIIKNIIPFTVLEDVNIDWNKLIGIDGLDISFDNSNIGVQELKIKLLGEYITFDIEVISLVKNENAELNIPTKHWARDAIKWVVSKGYIQGCENGDLQLNRTLTIAESYKALDRLFLANNVFDLINNRQIVAKEALEIKDQWFAYSVKSILSRKHK